MDTIKTHLMLLFLSSFFFAGLSNAAMTLSPTTATTAETVTVTMTGTLPPNINSMLFKVNFGDGSPIISSPLYMVAGTYSFSTRHIYSQSGTYTASGTTTLNTVSTPPQSLVETRKVSIFDAINQPPHGTVGEKYKHSIATTSSLKVSRFQIIHGKLPPGLKLERYGLISGIPTQKGKFDSTVQIIHQSGVQSSQPLTIFIDPGQLIVQVTPAEISISRGAGTRQKVTFSVTSPSVKINETIRSTQGVFLADGRVIGYNRSPMNINLNTLKPAASETVQITNSILSSAQKSRTSKITYRRVFKSINLKPGTGDTRIALRTTAAGQLRLSKLRIYFERNNRPLIMVTRNSQDLTGVIDIQYNGSGLLKGYWIVDKRIIQRVQKNLFYGKVLTLKTPKAPRLPTYSEGAHRLQFIITVPESARQKISFPEAIYHVEAKRS